ncbi:MAG: type I-C CRISPR-associated protein Cas8c/Csd1 [Lactobacillus sp.]|jgi:CRISPR-associated protein Csd1|nr:type I-C CRISPR-associated protein Cas8c/Csd1 [Lactobacillus sp.]
MTVFNELVKTFDDNQAKVGDFGESTYTLLPLYHVSVNVQIEITLTGQGKFSTAGIIREKPEQLTVIPATVEAANRSVNVAPFPLEDKIKYVAGDFSPYAGSASKVKRAKECYAAYLKLIQNWANSSDAPTFIKLVAKYIQEETVVADLLKVLTDEKDQKLVKTGEAFVRFKDNSPENADFVPWRDKGLFKSWETHYLTSLKDGQENTVDYITGELQPETNLVEKNVSPVTSGAKLISANDKSGFSYRGTFLDNEFQHVGLVSSQKMTHALKWLIQRQGIIVDTRVFLIWASGTRNNNRNSYLNNALNGLISGLIKSSSEETEDKTGKAVQQSYRDALFGQIKEISDNQKLNVLFLDAATTGRMAMTYYDLMDSNQLKTNLNQWRHCGINIRKYEGTVPFTPTLNQVINAAYLIGTGGQRFQTIRRHAMTQLLTAVIQAKPVSMEITRTILQRISRPMAYSGNDVQRGALRGLQIWQQDVRTYCALINYNVKGKLGMSLNQASHDRSYVFGRLLAISDQVERKALSENRASGTSSKERVTTAIRFLPSFLERPTTTNKRIWAAVMNSYFPKLHSGLQEIYMRHWQEANEQFEDDAMNTDKPLSGLAFKGFMDERTYLIEKAVAGKAKKGEDKNE